MKKLLIVICITVTTVAVSAQIPVDKQYHLGAGVVIGTWGTFAGNEMQKTPEQCIIWGLTSATAAGVGKELWDWSWRLTGDKNAKFDPADLAYTIGGGIIGTGLSYLGLKLFKKKPEQDDSVYFYFGAISGIKITF